MTRLAPLLLALGLVAAAAPGCVSLQQGGIFAADRDQVFVAYFDNETFFRNVEFRLTERLVEEILSRPGLRLTSEEEAEVIVSGRVVHVEQRVLSEDQARRLTSVSTTVSVVVEFHDAMTGDLIKRARLSQRAEYVPKLMQDIEGAREEVFRFLARDIVRELETEF